MYQDNRKKPEGARNLKRKVFAICVIILLSITTIYGASISTVKAATGQGDWITKYRIETADTGQLILDKDFTTGATSGSGSMVEGAQLKVTVTISIGVNNPSTNLNLATEMQHSSKDHYWEAQPGYSLGSYNPNSQSFSFAQNAGTLEIICYGVIPTGKVVQKVGNVTLHVPTPISLISLKDPSGAVLDQIRPNITDSAIDNFNTLLKDKQDKLASLSSSGVAPGYVELFQNVINEAQAAASKGFAEDATAMLKALEVSNEPASATMQILFLPLIVAFAVIAGVFGFMFMKIRGKVSYFQLVVEDQIKDLEGLTLRASKIDRTMSSNLESVKDRLKHLIGM